MKIYLFKNFNNYYNREIYGWDTLDEYITNYQLENNYAVRSTGESIDSTENGKRVNFAEHDGLRTELTYNYDPNQDWVPTYVICTDDDNNIKYRWFVIDYYKNRKGQFKLYLKRDTIFDFKHILINSKAYIERSSYLPSNAIPLLYNKDSDSFNEIKQNEYLLTDDTKLNWYVIYLAPNATYNKTIAININSYYIQATYDELDSIDYYTSIQKGKVVGISDLPTWSTNNYEYELKLDGYIYHYLNGEFYTTDTSSKALEILNKINKMTLSDKDQMLSIFKNVVVDTNIVEWTTYKDYNDNNNRNISTGDAYYNETLSYDIIESNNMSAGSGSDMRTLIDKYYKATSIYYSRQIASIKMKLETLQFDTYTFNITESLKLIRNLPYKALVIPCSNRFVNSDITKCVINGTTYNYNYELNTSIVHRLISDLKDSNNIYDVQLFPYCPIKHTVSDDKILFTGELTSNVDYYTSTSVSTSVVLMTLQDSNFTFNIRNTGEWQGSNSVKGVIGDQKVIKILHQCDSYRLCAPDGSSIYNLDLLANKSIKYFNIDCTLKPYSSYIHINPNFNYLNGIDTDDYRGLVIKSDFAIPMVSNNWETYVHNNVNYQKIFDRQIQNMDVNNKIANQQAIWSTVTGALQGASTGGFIGNSIGGKGGTIIGGAVGGVVSAAAGIADIHYQKQLQQENKSYATDTFNLNLGNIKAQANTLSKVDNFDYNNKIFPYIEFYSCTSEEKQLYKNKIRVSGFNVDAITDDLSSFIDFYSTDSFNYCFVSKYASTSPTTTFKNTKHMNYIKAKLINANTTDNLSNNILNDLAEELNKGVYI